MCGRYALIPKQTAWSAIGQDLGPHMDALLLELKTLRPRYNVSPSQTMPIVLEDREARRPAIHMARWGLIPAWWKQLRPPDNTHNARIEGIEKKPMWRAAWRHQRCLVPVSLWYEWMGSAGNKLPWALRPANDSEMMFAGLWDAWRDPQSGLETISFAIVTQDAVDGIRDIHNRMPLVLAPQIWTPWISRSLTDLRSISTELARNQVTELRAYRVKRFVSNSRNQGPECVEPDEADA